MSNNIKNINQVLEIKLVSMHIPHYKIIKCQIISKVNFRILWIPKIYLLKWTANKINNNNIE